MVDTDAAQTDDFGNGPEWVNTAQGSKITYMRYLPGVEHTPENAGVAIASYNGSAWSGNFMADDLNRYLPTGSLDVNDPIPRLVYQNRTGSNFKAYVRYLDDPASETVLPGNKSVCSRRWVPDTQALIYTAPCLARNSSARPAQVYWYDFPTKSWNRSRSTKVPSSTRLRGARRNSTATTPSSPSAIAPTFWSTDAWQPVATPPGPA